MACDLAEVMQHFGFSRFLVGSHDRGARVAHRLALDFPDRVEKLAVLDIVPTIEHFERTDMAFAARLLPLVLVRPAAPVSGVAD
jgi:haloacetate dehalogenase